MNKILKKVVSMVPVKKLLYNRFVLYGMCILALVNVVMYANVKDFNSVVTLLIIGFLVSFFSKNMIVILGIAIGVTYLLNYTSAKLISEGAENMEKDKEGENKEEATEETEENPEETEEETPDVDTAQTDEDKQKMYNSLQTDFKDFQKIQDSILTGMKEIDPLLTKAETFIEKFEHYGKQLEKSQ
jgi:hypothetical protein